MRSKHKAVAITAAAVVAVGIGGAAIAGAAGGGDDDARDTPITGSALDRAKAIALEQTGGGRVTETEVGDEEGAYEVEVTRADGSQVDVHLDAHFGVIGQDRDGEQGGGEAGGADD